MARSHFIVTVVAVGLCGTAALGSSQALALDLKSLFKKNDDKAVCYRLVSPPAILALNVKEHSPLDITKKKPSKYSKPNTTTYSVVGKSVHREQQGTAMRGIDGGVMVRHKEGAWMDFTRYGLRSPANNFPSVSHFECASDQAIATPTRWTCNELAITPTLDPQLRITENAVLNLVNPNTADERTLRACNFFETLRDE